MPGTLRKFLVALRNRVRVLPSTFASSTERVDQYSSGCYILVTVSATNAIPIDSRRQDRTLLKCEVALDWKAQNGVQREDGCVTIDLSDGGMAVETGQHFMPDSKIIVRSDALKIAYLSTVRYCRWEHDRYRLGLEFVAKTMSVSKLPWNEVDLYGMLRLSRDADFESIERVYKTLARRYHPDNQETGDAEAFLCLNEAYHILSDPARKQAYDQEWDKNRTRPAAILEKRELFEGIAGEQNRRFAVLCLLYRQKMTDFNSQGFNRLDLSHLTGCTAEETDFAMWYLIEKGYVRRANDSSFTITAEGVDHVEQHRGDFMEPMKLIEAGTRPRVGI